MKKILVGVGLGFGLLLVVIALTFGILAYRGAHSDASSLTFVKETLPKILTGWNRDALLVVESDAMALYASKERVGQLFSIFARALGNFHHVEEPVGESILHVDSSGINTSASYRAKAQFEKGWAEISMVLVFENDRWLVTRFNINSPLLGPFETEIRDIFK